MVPTRTEYLPSLRLHSAMPLAALLCDSIDRAKIRTSSLCNFATRGGTKITETQKARVQQEMRNSYGMPALYSLRVQAWDKAGHVVSMNPTVKGAQPFTFCFF